MWLDALDQAQLHRELAIAILAGPRGERDASGPLSQAPGYKSEGQGTSRILSRPCVKWGRSRAPVPAYRQVLALPPLAMPLSALNEPLECCSINKLSLPVSNLITYR